MASEHGSTDTSGRLYGRPKATPDEVIVHCGPGTLGGELLRRYWQPLAMAREATNLPKLVKIFDEELVLYRDGAGVPGLLYPRCMHRGTSLLYGKVEQDGIRCCYHGWKFDAEGHCLDMACEPDSSQKARIRQPWYPLVEKYGIIFTYMGPPERQPLFPRFSHTETLAEDEELVAIGGVTSALGGDDSPVILRTDYNWWNFHDNVIDPFHLYFLHSRLNGIQFVETWNILPEVSYQRARDGARSIQYRDLGDGRVHLRLGQSFMPNIGGIGAVNDDVGQSGLLWTIAIDDTHFRIFMLAKAKHGINQRDRARLDSGIFSGRWGPGKKARDWTLEDEQTWQSDYQCQKGQGDISLHSDEHLSAALDGGLAMIRRMFRQQAEIVAEGGDPVGVTFDEPYVYSVTSGIGILDKETMACIDGWDGREMPC